MGTQGNKTMPPIFNCEEKLMQKKLIAVAVAGLMSGAAFAQTSVTLGGKFDACYAFSKASNADGTGATGTGPVGTNQGGKTTETQQDGCNTSSRVTIGAKEQIAKGYDIRIDYDIRFGSVHEGKSGLAGNDKKVMAFTTPAGTLQWGVANLEGQNYHIAEKPYMVTPKDTELVKFGVSQLREESLTSRNTSYWSPTLTVGPVKTLLKGSYAFGDQRKSGSSNIDNTGSGDAFTIGSEGVVLDGLLDWGLDYNRRAPTGSSSTGANGMIYTHAYINLRPLPGSKNLKLTAAYNTYRGYNSSAQLGATVDSSFKEKNTNFVVSYNFDGKAEVGVGVSHLTDVGASRNSGRGIMIGGSYFLSKSVQVYANLAKNNFDNNEVVTGGKYVGTGTNFAGNLSKVDSRTIKVGITKEF
jgi:predicted porin